MLDNFTISTQYLQLAALSGCLGVAISIYAIQWYLNPLNAIPTIGSSSLPGLSYFSAPHNARNLRAVLEEGSRKYPESAFKVALPEHWLVLFSGRRMIEEIKKRPEEDLSAKLAVHDLLQIPYALEPPIAEDNWTTGIVKGRFKARKLPDVILEVIDEVPIAIGQRIPVKGKEWTSVVVYPAMQKIVAQASNRAFVGLPLCRNEDYLTQTIDFTGHLAHDAVPLRLVPGFIKPFIAPFLTKVKYSTRRVAAYLHPIIQERMKASAVVGEGWDNKPNDILQLILEKATRLGETPTVITQRVLSVNFASIHTTSSILTHTLYHLAEEPGLLVPLREEIEANISAHGRTATALGNMWKLDSTIREVLRHYGIGLALMHRICAKDITLYDGTFIPKGTAVSAAAYSLHHHDATLENAGTFDPFRYARMRSATEKSAGTKHHSATISAGYIPFGYGVHACPGRYFASYELKAILAHIILEYDIKLGGDGVRPAAVHYGPTILPALDAGVLFKKRATSAQP